jgi:DNA-binding LacI/PurR family transcriptional regulator
LLAAHLAAPLTTVRHPQQDLGSAAFNLWHASRGREEPMRGKVLPVELIVRGSTQRPGHPLARHRQVKAAEV